jgi:hypothetical protein
MLGFVVIAILYAVIGLIAAAGAIFNFRRMEFTPRSRKVLILPTKTSLVWIQNSPAPPEFRSANTRAFRAVHRSVQKLTDPLVEGTRRYVKQW